MRKVTRWSASTSGETTCGPRPPPPGCAQMEPMPTRAYKKNFIAALLCRRTRRVSGGSYHLQLSDQRSPFRTVKRTIVWPRGRLTRAPLLQKPEVHFHLHVDA